MIEYRKNSGKPQIVTVQRRRFPVIGDLQIRGRKYLLLQCLNGRRSRFLAWNPSTGPAGKLCTVVKLANTDSTIQHVHVLSRLPNQYELPQVIDYHRGEKFTHLVMTWVNGVDLTDYFHRIQCKKVVRPSPYEAVRLIKGLAHSLRTLNRHAQLIHGDLKPSNLILTRKPSRLCLVDFGSAWPIEQSGFRLDGDGMTRVYAAPELQVAGGVVDHRSDQFSASIILYQLLTLRVPYEGFGGKAGRPEYCQELSGSLVRPSENGLVSRSLGRQLKSELDELVCKGVQLCADDRYQTASAWLDELDNVCNRLKSDERRANDRTRVTLRKLFTRVFDRSD